MQELNSEKPCLVKTAQGFSVSYKKRFLYSKYAPNRAILGTIENLKILPNSLILILSPALWLGLRELLEKLPENCFILGIEIDENLHKFAREKFFEIKKDFQNKKKTDNSNENYSKEKIEVDLSNVALLPFSENEYIVNILSGERNVEELKIPHISNFRRAIPIEMSAGTQFDKKKYAEIASLAQNTIASFWKNRITLTRLGRLFSRNLFKNLANLPNSIDFKNLMHKISEPIFVFGAGESLEATIREIPKEEIEKCFVIVVDAASPALKVHGIRIDAVLAVEGQLAIEKAYIGGASKNSLIIADMTSRKAVTCHTKTGFSYFASKYTNSEFFRNLTQKEFFPPLVPPLGSVGLAAVYIALSLRKNQNVPIFVSGLDFSFSLGRTHTKNTPAHIARLASLNRFSPVENYAAAFRNGAKKITGKNGIEVYTDTALEGYAKSFADFFSTTVNLYDCGKQGISLGLEEINSEKTAAYLETISAPMQETIQNSSLREEPAAQSLQTLEQGNLFLEPKLLRRFAPQNDDKICHCRTLTHKIRTYLEAEEKALKRIKELLMFGRNVASCSCSLEDELHSLITPREYLFLHFPDGYKCDTSDLSFLKRIRGQLDFFLKDIRCALKTKN